MSNEDSLTTEDLAFLWHVCSSNAERHFRLAVAMSEEDRAGSSTEAIGKRYERLAEIFEKMLHHDDATEFEGSVRR